MRLLFFRLRIVTEPKELQASGSVPAKERQRAMISPFARATGFPIGRCSIPCMQKPGVNSY